MKAALTPPCSSCPVPCLLSLSHIAMFTFACASGVKATHGECLPLKSVPLPSCCQFYFAASYRTPFLPQMLHRDAVYVCADSRRTRARIAIVCLPNVCHCLSAASSTLPPLHNPIPCAAALLMLSACVQSVSGSEHVQRVFACKLCAFLLVVLLCCLTLCIQGPLPCPIACVHVESEGIRCQVLC